MQKITVFGKNVLVLSISSDKQVQKFFISGRGLTINLMLLRYGGAPTIIGSIIDKRSITAVKVVLVAVAVKAKTNINP